MSIAPLDPNRTVHNIYEINTVVYLRKLSDTHGAPAGLADIPDEEIARIASYGCDAVWLMGIWERSPLAVKIGLHDSALLKEIRAILPDFDKQDILGSAYAIKSYRICDTFGGEAGLAAFRSRLAAHGMKLLLDFVPNHTAFDHGWTSSHPDYYIHGSIANALRHPSWYYGGLGKRFAHGRDPFYAPWPDVAQLNAFSEEYRQASIETLRYIATICDGVRCDMAMLMTNSIFMRTWGRRAGTPLDMEYWQEVITGVRTAATNFIFIAECYWDMQAALLEQGFDFCYDKELYDYLRNGDMLGAQAHMSTHGAIADRLLHFLENHDEPRAAATFEINAHRSALEFIIAQSGPRLWHDGQFEGYRAKIPVHIGRGPAEQIDPAITEMYRTLLHP